MAEILNERPGPFRSPVKGAAVGYRAQLVDSRSGKVLMEEQASRQLPEVPEESKGWGYVGVAAEFGHSEEIFNGRWVKGSVQVWGQLPVVHGRIPDQIALAFSSTCDQLEAIVIGKGTEMYGRMREVIEGEKPGRSNGRRRIP